MFKLPDFPSVDFSKFPSVDFSKFPSFMSAAADDASLDVPVIDIEKLTSAMRDAAYLTVGVGSAIFEQAQTRSRELASTVADGYEATKIQFDTVVDRVEALLPDKAAAVFGQVREMGDAATQQLLGFMRNAA
jgi:hypothetical protein